MRFKEFLKEDSQPTEAECIEQFRAMRDFMMRKDFGTAKVYDIKPMKHAHVFWHSKSNTFLFMTLVRIKGLDPTETESRGPVDLHYWIEWDPVQRKIFLVADFDTHQKGRLGGALKSLAGNDPAIVKRIENKSGRYFSIYVDWPTDLNPW
jgi:hypothetical protein